MGYTQNDMKLNPNKCVNMNVCFMKNPPEIVPLKMCLKDLKQVDNVKILGVTISSDLKWDLHMSQVLRKASNKLYMLKVLKKFKLSTVDLLTMGSFKLQFSLGFVTSCYVIMNISIA